MSLYLVTGGAGFIGSHVVDELLHRGERVRVVDNFSTGKHGNIAHNRKHIELITGDLADQKTARRAVRGVDYVLHLAAIPSVQRSVADPLAVHEANVTATLNLLVAARDAGVHRFVYSSSSAVYGDGPELPKREDMATAPCSPYAVSKLAGERYCQIFYSVYGLPTVCLRYFNVFGPRQDPTSQYAAVIHSPVHRVDTEWGTANCVWRWDTIARLHLCDGCGGGQPTGLSGGSGNRSDDQCSVGKTSDTVGVDR